MEIVDVRGDEVTFIADAKLTTATDHTPEEDRRVPGTFVTSRKYLYETTGEVTRHGTKMPASVQLERGARGLLYWEERASQVQGTTVRSACVARGAEVQPVLRDENAFRAKWPDEGAFADSAPVKVEIQKLVLRGHLRGHAQVLEIDLLDKETVMQGQTISWASGAVTLELTKAGAGRLGLAWKAATPYELWAVSLDCDASPIGEIGFDNTIDLRDYAFAEPAQEIKLQHAPFETSLVLTRDGMHELGIMSGAASEGLRALFANARERPHVLEGLREVLRIDRGRRRSRRRPDVRTER
ncbi:MAG TPA: hypothetical protein VK427_03510 [Kofleriaceae bacterium]|nr:hypothetical protein [Kofleriaceae bacterium]